MFYTDFLYMKNVLCRFFVKEKYSMPTFCKWKMFYADFLQIEMFYTDFL